MVLVESYQAIEILQTPTMLVLCVVLQDLEKVPLDETVAMLPPSPIQHGSPMVGLMR